VTISVFDLFKVGIGPSSSHTVGPMRAACSFASRLSEDGVLSQVAGVRCELFGSLGATGHGHGSVKAVVLGLEGEQPDLVDPVAAEPRLAAVRADGTLRLAGKHPVAFSVDDDVVLHRRKRLEFHSNGMVFRALNAGGHELLRREYYSVGGGFVVDEDDKGNPAIVADRTPVRYPFSTGEELLAQARATGLRISDVMTISGHSGPNTLNFIGAIRGHAKLAPGNYAVTFTASNSALTSSTSKLHFAILRR